MYHHLCDEKKDVKIINCSITPSMFDYINEGGCIETYNESYHLEWLKKCESIFGFNLTGYNKIRMYTFLAERFLSYWFLKNFKVKELPIIGKDLSDYRNL